MLLFKGENGQGKSNLLEAIYLLAIAKSARASTDRELVRKQSISADTYSRVAAEVDRNGDSLRLQVDFQSRLTDPSNTEQDGEDDSRSYMESITVQKYFRVNGAPRRASGLIGQLNAVMFSADDLDLIYGSPSVRRRYLDILISQLDPGYLRSLQRYQRIVQQRNHLLKSLRVGSAMPAELEFWDEELIVEGSCIMARRITTVGRLSEVAGPIHWRLSGKGEALEVIYRPNVALTGDATAESLARDIRGAIEDRRQRETAQGVTVSGPHRDDLQVLVDGLDAGAYASRGQARTAVLALKLAEADYLKEQRGDEPVILLDDVLSELDAGRRAQVLEHLGAYQQTFITTTDLGPIEGRFLSEMQGSLVVNGHVEPMGPDLAVQDGPSKEGLKG